MIADVFYVTFHTSFYARHIENFSIFVHHISKYKKNGTSFLGKVNYNSSGKV